VPNPTQPARYFQGLPTGPAFEREYEIQETIPIDGSKGNLRGYSPFVMRTLPPTILGDSLNILQASPPSSQETRGRRDFAGAIRSLDQSSPSADTYRQLVNRGETIPGLTAASVRDIDQAISNSARNQSIAQTAGARVVPAVTNDATALSIILQLKRLIEVPPLVLLINPTSFSVRHQKIAQFQERSRYGYIYQVWGEELAKVSFSCTIGAFIAGKTSPTQRVASGVQYASKRDSASFQQLMAVLAVYQSSGQIQDLNGNATGRASRANLMVGNTAIEYDNNVYVGHMDSFSYSEEETLQGGGMKFEIEFTAVKMFDVAESKVSLTPLNSPNNAYNPSAAVTASQGSRLSRTFLGSGGTQLLTAPTVGTQGSSDPPQPWAGEAVVVEDTEQTGVVVTTRRR